jgi:NAD-dependent DNA ligase
MNAKAKVYVLKDCVPAWHFDPPTFRQFKVLRFFGVDVNQSLTKGKASGLIGRFFSDPANKHLWAAYVFTTGDEDDSTADLRPCDRTALASVHIPDDWRPKRAAGTLSSARKALEQMVTDVLKDGSPFDDSPPSLSIAGTAFCFTGKFGFGERKQCQEAVVSRGGSVTDGVTRKTDVLVIGNDANPNWSHGNYGNKIADAMLMKLQHGKPVIISELYWRALLNTALE